jgi:hypothetical protein
MLLELTALKGGWSGSESRENDIHEKSHYKKAEQEHSIKIANRSFEDGQSSDIWEQH